MQKTTQMLLQLLLKVHWDFKTFIQLGTEAGGGGGGGDIVPEPE